MTTRFSSIVLLLALSGGNQVSALSTGEPQQGRRAVMGWIAGGAAAGASFVAFPQASLATAAEDAMNVDDFLKTGTVSMPMGVSGQAGKSKPETGIYLRDGSEISRDSRTGDVLAEIVVNGSDGSKAAVLASYSSPWPLAKGSVYDVECRDASTGDGAFLSVSQTVGGKSIDQLKDSFILDSLLKSNGRFSFYGPPTDVKVKASEVKGAYKIMDISFSTISQATQTEIPRKARLAATIPAGTDQAVMLVASSSAIRWKKGSEKAIAATIESFHAVQAPASSLAIRVKPTGREIFE